MIINKEPNWFWCFIGIFNDFIVFRIFTGNLDKIDEKDAKQQFYKLDIVQASDVSHQMKGFPSIDDANIMWKDRWRCYLSFLMCFK